jgi:hypothetical protein
MTSMVQKQEGCHSCWGIRLANGNGKTASKEGAEKLDTNYLFKHLFRKNGGCGEMCLFIKISCIVFGEEGAYQMTEIFLVSWILI